MNARRLILSVFATVVGSLVFTCAPALAAEAPEAPAPVTVEAITPTSATFHGELNPGKTEPAGTYEVDEYQFLYRESSTECKGGSKAPASPGMSLGGGQEAVTEGVSGLKARTEYTACLVTRNSTTDEEAEGPTVTFTTHGAPVIASESVSNVLSTSATLEAQINPLGEDTHYYFQYGTKSCAPSPSSCTDVPAPPGDDIGSAESRQTASFDLRGLAPETTYHYRVLAVNALGAVEGADQTFTTPTAAGQLPGLPQIGTCPNEQLRAEQSYGSRLPDCRAYEMVSPVEKNGADAIKTATQEGTDDYTRAAVSGEAIVFESLGSFANPAGSQYYNQFLSRRGPGGWSTQSITPPYNAYNTDPFVTPYENLVFTPELSKGVGATIAQLTSEAPAGLRELYEADFASGSYQWVSKVPRIPGSEEGVPYKSTASPYSAYWPMGASTDLSHVVFLDRESGLLYEWVDGEVIGVSVANNGEPMLADAGSRSSGSSLIEYWGSGNIQNTVSSDGSRVFFTSLSTDQLYARENAERPQSPLEGDRCTVLGDACTVEVSASQRGVPDPDGPQEADYVGASADGSKVFFSSRAELTGDAYTGTEDNAANLYEYDLDSGRLTDLTVDRADVDGAAVQGVVQISEDGSYVYFVAAGNLAAGAVAGEANLYVSHEGGAPAFIATLAGGDERDWGSNTRNVFDATAVSGDGTQLAFMSERSLTGYDNEPAEGVSTSGTSLENPEACGVGCNEVYTYDASTGSLTCVSCNPSGERPAGPSSLGESNGPFDSEHQRRNLSEDGSRLFFVSYDALVPHDSNGRQNIYEYEDGHVYPISDVAGDYNSYFLDASSSGGDVFFATADELVAQDQDESIDVYDARVGGGFPTPVSVPPCDNGDSCKPPPTPQPGVFGAPASATFSGAGNPVSSPPVVKPKSKKKAVKCAKGKKSSRGKCVKRRDTRKAKKSAKGRK